MELQVLPVGAAEIAERLGVRQQTVAQWKLRGVLPAPRWTVSRLPAWNWPEIEHWARARIPSIDGRRAFVFRLYLSLDGLAAADVEPALHAAGAQLPIDWKPRRTLVTFEREADNYTEAVVFVMNQLPQGVASSGMIRPGGELGS